MCESADPNNITRPLPFALPFLWDSAKRRLTRRNVVRAHGEPTSPQANLWKKCLRREPSRGTEIYDRVRCTMSVGLHPDPSEAQDATTEGPLLVARVTIKRHIRDMDASLESGGSEPKLLGDTEGRQWMVKARNSQQGPRMLAAEYVAAALGARIGALIQPAAVCMIPVELAATLKFQSGTAWLDGESFGSAFMDGTKPYLDSMAPDIRNRDELLGPVAIDTWLTLHDSRQARVREMDGGGYQVLPIDFGYSIGTGDWDGAVLAGRPPIGGLFDPHGWAVGEFVG
jgi:hypothetical protein